MLVSSKMLKSIIFNSSSPLFSIIQDDNSSRGVDLFKTILRRDIEDDAVKQVHLISIENPSEYYLEKNKSSKVTKQDFFKDPNYWIRNINEHGAIFNAILCSKDTSSTVMIDSLSMIVFLEGQNYVINSLYRLKEGFRKVTCLLHGDAIIDSQLVKKLKFLSDIYLTVTVCRNLLFDCSIQKKRKTIEGVYKKPSGKVLILKENYIVDPELNFHSEVHQQKDVMPITCSGSNKSNLKNLTTFRLGLDIMESEKIARDNLVLPYLRSETKNVPINYGKEGQIVYYADSGDDLEEDPDDDLVI